MLIIDPRPAARIAGRHRLDHEKLRPQIRCDRPVPILRRDLLDLVPLVVGRIVHQHVHRSQRGHRLLRDSPAAPSHRSGRSGNTGAPIRPQSAARPPVDGLARPGHQKRQRGRPAAQSGSRSIRQCRWRRRSPARRVRASWGSGQKPCCRLAFNLLPFGCAFEYRSNPCAPAAPTIQPALRIREGWHRSQSALPDVVGPEGKCSRLP